MATTPRGTRTFSMRSPLGRTQPSTTSPTGSARPATWRSPLAMEAIRASDRRSLSTIVAETPSALARSTSAPLAVRISSDRCKRRSAAAPRAASFVSVEASARARLAALARWPSSLSDVITERYLTRSIAYRAGAVRQEERVAATTMEAPKSGVPVPADDIEEPPKADAFLRFANWVSEAMGRPTNIIFWFVVVVAWTFVFAFGGHHVASGSWLPLLVHERGLQLPAQPHYDRRRVVHRLPGRGGSQQEPDSADRPAWSHPRRRRTRRRDGEPDRRRGGQPDGSARGK